MSDIWGVLKYREPAVYQIPRRNRAVSDVTNTGNGNREPESENLCTAATRLRIQNGGQNKRKGSTRNKLGRREL